MCLAIPGKVTSIEEKNGVRSGLQFREASRNRLPALPEQNRAKPGE